jgi:hypothetical protein
VPEAQLEDAGSGLAPLQEGWFVVNVRDAEWCSQEVAARYGASVAAETDDWRQA